MATRTHIEEVLREEILECPNPSCRKHGLVRCVHDDDDVWKCLYCGHAVNLTKGTQSDRVSVVGFMFAVLIVMGLLISLG